MGWVQFWGGLGAVLGWGIGKAWCGVQRAGSLLASTSSAAADKRGRITIVLPLSATKLRQPPAICSQPLPQRDTQRQLLDAGAACFTVGEEYVLTVSAKHEGHKPQRCARCRVIAAAL